MKNVIVVIVSIFILSMVAWGAKSDLPRDLSGQKLQFHSPDSSKNIALTVASRTVDMADDLSYSVYTPSACKFRVMSTATKAGSQKALLAGGRLTLGVKAGSSFINFSGCTNGELDRQ